MQTAAVFLFGALVFSAVLMSALWLAAKRINKASIVDPAWAFLIAGLALFYAVAASGDPARRFAAAFMGAAWGTRLGFFILFFRVAGKPEDPRYRELLASWGENRDLKLYRFFMLQALAAAVFSIPFLIVSSNQRPGLTWLEWTSLGLWAAAFVGETLADLQLEAFKAVPANKGLTCRDGLWKYSRHPNYFFEFMIWCSAALFSLSSPLGFAALLCPALIFHFLFNVTGIPKAEEQALRSRGEDYRDYQRRTSKFFPWFPKEGAL
ncbi:MAG: DUF1295 domain-containing protein [Candidatus Omnitrophica bacterium]|nr:DUF1295 domain-containing protein [Candidatus Omnitrophota bacterium]